MITRLRSGKTLWQKTNNTEAAETREDAGTKTEQDIRTESKEDASSFSIQSKLSPPRRAIIREGRWRAALLSLQNCSALSRSIASFRSTRNLPKDVL